MQKMCSGGWRSFGERAAQAAKCPAEYFDPAMKTKILQFLLSHVAASRVRLGEVVSFQPSTGGRGASEVG